MEAKTKYDVTGKHVFGKQELDLTVCRCKHTYVNIITFVSPLFATKAFLYCFFFLMPQI
jgi:hypothetical protein